MFNNKYGKFLTLIIILLIIAIIALIGYFVYDICTKHNTEKDASDIVDVFEQQFVNNINKIEQIENTNEIDEINSIQDEPQKNENNSSNNNSASNNSNKNNSGSTGVHYQGYTVIGTIQISKINVKVPIVQELSTKSLSKATVLIYGKLNEQENAVVIGHNNRNGTFFSNLKRLSNGDKITITSSNGKTVNYSVYNIFEASPDDTSFWQRDTNGLSEITLSTCTDRDDSKRTIVLAKEI